MAKPTIKTNTSALSTERESLSIIKSEDSIKVQMDLEHAPMPDQSMTANWACAVLEDDELSLLFGHKIPATDRIVSVLCIALPLEAADRTLKGGNTPAFLEGSQKVLEASRIKAVECHYNPGSMPERITVHKASAVYMARANTEAELRFFVISPTGLHRGLQTGLMPQGTLEPVVRVLLGLGLLVGLMIQIGSLLEGLRKEDA